jgi:hypothetical protein
MTRSERLDRYYTPDSIAELVAAAIEAHTVTTCADTACGQGHLLKAVATRFPAVRCIGVDVDHRAVLHLRKARPRWTVLHGNALTFPLTTLHRTGRAKSIDVTVGNPPFSMYRSKAVMNPLVVSGRSSVALAHVTRDLLLLRPTFGGIYILPESCLATEVDESARRAIEATHRIEVLKRLQTTTFSHTRARTVVARITRRFGSDGRNTALASALFSDVDSPNPVLRGGLPRHLARPSALGLPYCHSTDLRDLAASGGRSVRRLPRVKQISRGVLVPGEYLLIPRVGRPIRSQLRNIRLDRHVQLSDCVIAIKIAPHEASRHLLEDAGLALQSLYSGTGAPYITVRRVLNWVGSTDEVRTYTSTEASSPGT